MSTTPPADTGVIRRSTGEQAALYIRRLIFDGVLRPGARVQQDEIAQTLGISRIPIREALIALEREGWVTIKLHRGAFISAIDAEIVRDHYELYGIIYGFAARRAFGRGDDELIKRLTAIEALIAASDDPVTIGRLSVDFHSTIVEAAHSPRIKVVLRAMSALVPGEFFSEVPDAIDVQKRGTAAILRAGRRGDRDRVAEEYLRAMRRVGDKVVEVFDKRGLFDASDGGAT
jgi:DNA-binding GntR family transcriptional regulator